MNLRSRSKAAESSAAFEVVAPLDEAPALESGWLLQPGTLPGRLRFRLATSWSALRRDLEVVAPTAVPRRRLWHVSAALVILTLLVPYFMLLEAPLLGGDSARWVTIGREVLHQPWSTFLQAHFIGYRPLTALSFAIGQNLEHCHAIYSVNLFVLFAFLLTLFRVLCNAVRLHPLLALAFTVLTALHPVVEEVVSMPARRGDLLVAWFAAGYVGGLLRGGTGARALWLLAALASKEAAFVLPVGACLHFAARAHGGLLTRLRRSVYEFLPDLLIAGAFFAVRWIVLRRVGGYPSEQVVGQRWLVPADYWLNVTVPHLRALSELSPYPAVLTGTLVVVLGFVLLWRSLRCGLRLLPALLCADAALYVIAGFVWPRLLLPALLLTMLWFAQLCAARDRVAIPVVMTLGLCWSILQVWSDPAARLGFIAQTTRNYVDTLKDEVSRMPPGPTQVVLCDCPEAWNRSTLELRLDLSSDLPVLARDRELLLTTTQLEEWVEAVLPGCELRLISLVHLSVHTPDATVRVTRFLACASVGGWNPEPSVARVRLEHRAVDPFVFARVADLEVPVAIPQPGRFVVDLRNLRPRRGSAWLFAASSTAQKRIPQPNFVNVDLVPKDAVPFARF